MANNTIIGLKSLRENMDKYISQVKSGKSFIVIKRSKPVFKLSPLDKWGDDGIWENIVDFTKVNPTGVSIGDVLKSLKKLNEQSR